MVLYMTKNVITMVHFDICDPGPQNHSQKYIVWVKIIDFFLC